MTDLLTTTQFVNLTGVTFRVLDYWLRNGVLEPAVEASGSGSRRQFFPDQVPMVRTLGHIQAALGHSQSGVSTVLLAEVYDALEREQNFLDLGYGVTLTWEPAECE